MAKKIGAPEALTEAAIWHARIAQHPALAQDEKFLAWLCVARNRERYAAIANTWDVMGMIAASPHVLAIRRSSLKSVSWRAQRASMAKRAAIGAAFAAGVAIALVAGAQFYHANFASQTYQTARLERRVLTLQDGSSIALDADTSLVVRYRLSERDVSLVRGQASFTVAHDAHRPFRVITPQRSILATGTIFNVEAVGAQTIVTLMRGRVVVGPLAKGGPHAVALSPGQQLVAEGGKAWVRAVDPAQVEAWEQGRVVFDDETLPAAVAKMSRYAHRRWRVDPALDTVKISGAFDIDEPDAFIDTVENYLHISATVTAGGVTVLSAPTVPTKK